MTREEIVGINPDAIVWDGLDEAIIGVCSRINSGPLLVTTSNSEYEIQFDDGEDEDYLDGEYDNKPYITTFGRTDFGPVVLYSTEKIINLLMVDMEVDETNLTDDVTIEDLKREMALEYFYYNIDGVLLVNSLQFII